MHKSDVFVYISGKYTAPQLIEVHEHVLTALKVAVKLADIGVLYFCPHTHSQFMDVYSPSAPHSYWMRLDLAVISKLTNCMIMLDNYQTSTGAQMERELAIKKGQPVFYSLTEFYEWYQSLPD